MLLRLFPILLLQVDLLELNEGFKRMKLNRPVVLSVEDFDELTEQGRLTTLGEPGGEEINADGFEGMVLSQLRRYTGQMFRV